MAGLRGKRKWPHRPPVFSSPVHGLASVAACAIRFAELGYTVLAGVRNTADGERFERFAADNPTALDRRNAVDSIAGAVLPRRRPACGPGNNAGIASHRGRSNWCRRGMAPAV